MLDGTPLDTLILFECYAVSTSRLDLKCDGTRAETRFRLSAKRTSPFQSAEASVQSTTGSRGVRISGINTGYTMFRGSVESTGYPLHSPVSPSLPLPCVTVCHHISTGVYTVTDVYGDRGTFIFAVNTTYPSRSAWPWRWNHYDPLECRKLFTSTGLSFFHTNLNPTRTPSLPHKRGSIPYKWQK
jgi:hypothetical protein